ncbi:MAG TPA: dihydroorotate dehydrogenase [Candidatus Limnocylindria bacterium]|jgi:dihydroorotate dehydrogenase (NAD+) catalytic subunit
MPWRRFRKKVERPIDVSKSIEESLDDAADGEADEDLVELAELDGANITEAATGQPDDDRTPGELGTRLRDALATEEQRGGLPSERPLARRTSRSHEGPSEEDPHAAIAARYPEIGVDLEVEAARGLRLKNPVMTASGTFGQGVEYAELIDVSRLGAIVNKGTTPAPRPGNPQYRIAETPSGILNSIGLENPGATEVARKYGKAWAELGVAVIVNVAGYSVDDYVYVVHEMTGTPGVVAYEINVSCPNVKGGMLFGCDPDLAAEVTRAVKAETDLPIIVKLTPNAPDVVAVARACEEAGADALTAINTVLGMRVDTRRRRPILGTGSGGLSGPAIRPIAVHITYQVAQAVRIPIIGAGGITNAQDALEFLMAGASSVQVGTATFADPLAPLRVIEGLAAYVKEQGLSSIRDVIGAALPVRED